MMDKRVTVQENLAQDLPPVAGDVNQLEQVVMNFLVNARDAMPYGGTITVATRTVDAGPGAPDVPPYVPPGRYVLLTVSDTGVGIPEEIQKRIFEPFFTTKERGKGTGLGLAMVYGVVTDHKGFVTVRSKVNEGTTFTVYLPASTGTVVAVKKPALASVRGTETILLVDDDEAVLSFVKETLEVNGYKVIATPNPMSGLDAYQKMHSEIALVITDVVMPLIDGRELMKQITDIDPSARFLTVSGYSRYAERADDVKPDIFLQKPFEARDLLSAVRRIIDRGNALRAR
jgi:CheY-like chemotaxis protein